MGFTKRMGTTAHPPVPKGLFDDCRVQYLSNIDMKMKKYKIPPELVLNGDQTLSRQDNNGKTGI